MLVPVFCHPVSLHLSPVSPQTLLGELEGLFVESDPDGFGMLSAQQFVDLMRVLLFDDDGPSTAQQQEQREQDLGAAAPARSSIASSLKNAVTKINGGCPNPLVLLAL